MLRRSTSAKAMPPARNTLPFLLLLVVVFLSLFSLHRPDFRLSFLRPSESDQKTLVLGNPSSCRSQPSNSTSNFRFIVKVLAYDRLDSLARCLRSIANADYDGDRVDLHIFLDHFRASDAGNDSGVLDQRLEGARRMLGFVDGFEWKFGDKLVHYRTGNVGLQAQWLEAWWPSSDDEFAFVVEDDLELSPVYYRYLKKLIAAYYYDRSNFNPSIYGASLQRPRFVAGKHGNKLQLDDDTHIFLYQIVGTWGQLLFPKPWKEFRLWYDTHKLKNIQPILMGMVTTGWYKRMGERIWTPWFIKFIHTRGYYNIYTNLLQERALSVSHREAGVNYGRKVGPDSQLINSSSLDLNLWSMQPLSSLKWFDFCFREVIPGRIVKTLDELGPLLHSLQRDKTVIILSLYGVADAYFRNLLCHFENLDIHNYLILGQGGEFLDDLTRRGHAVIDTEELVQDLRKHVLKSSWSSTTGRSKEVVATAYVIRKSIGMGYNVWLVSGNMIPTSNIFCNFTQEMHEFATASELELSFFRSSASTFLDENLIIKLTSSPSLTDGEWPSGTPSFGQLAARFSQENKLPMQTINISKIAYAITPNDEKQSSLDGGQKMVFWPADMNLNVLKDASQKVANSYLLSPFDRRLATVGRARDRLRGRSGCSLWWRCFEQMQQGITRLTAFVIHRGAPASTIRDPASEPGFLFVGSSCTPSFRRANTMLGPSATATKVRTNAGPLFLFLILTPDAGRLCGLSYQKSLRIRGNKVRLDDEEHLILYQLVGTWGQLLFPKPWKEFRLCNFLRERALSVSHREAGVNYRTRAGPDSKLIINGSLDVDLWDIKPLSSLKWRGHPVIDTEKLLLDVKRGSWNAISKQGMEVLVTTHVIKKSVEKGYNAWLISGNMIPTGDQFSKSFHAKYDFATANDLELSFFKSSSRVLRFWKENGLPIKTIDVEKIAHRLTPNQGKKNDFVHGRKMIFWSPDLKVISGNWDCGLLMRSYHALLWSAIHHSRW
ncbi:hypothetical protein EJ110_NYTH33489 [Nymphaea thermarum]|nr:hypothetical protein EJ110_NYTH33489 [Nymphaea thermarum]